MDHGFCMYKVANGIRNTMELVYELHLLHPDGF